MEGDKIKDKEIVKGAFAVIWVGDADGPNQNREEESKTRYDDRGMLRIGLGHG